MSYTAVGKNKVYASIEDLPENQKLVDGDRILIQTEDGTALVDYSNVKIDLNHCTFGTQVSQLIEFTSTVETFIEEMNSEFEAIKDETTQMKVSIQKLQEQMEGCRLLFKFIMGAARTYGEEYIQQLTEGSLAANGLELYQDCKDSVLSTVPDFEFNKYNLLT